MSLEELKESRKSLINILEFYKYWRMDMKQELDREVKKREDSKLILKLSGLDRRSVTKHPLIKEQTKYISAVVKLLNEIFHKLNTCIRQIKNLESIAEHVFGRILETQTSTDGILN